MGQILHGSATTTDPSRFQPMARLRACEGRYGVNPQKTVANFAKARSSVSDLPPTGPIAAQIEESKSAQSEEAVVVAFRRHTYAAARRLSFMPVARPKSRSI